MATCVTVDLTPACLDWTGVRAGDRNQVYMTLSLSGGMPVDLTGQTVTAQARKTHLDETEHLDAVISVIDAAAGRISVRWPGDDVRAVLAGQQKWTGVWDLQIQAPPEDPVTVVEGKFGATYDVTRPP